LVLEADDAAEDFFGAFEAVGLAGIEKGDGVCEGISRAVYVAGF
jgi:hypothetical protein